ncbi:MAG: hypothetical protein PHV18_15475 [Lachnospiraceae bacterium]|nr:hypothetical protein [Lachnospiraceae bacterium]
MAKKSEYQDMSNQISSMMYEAKLRQGIEDNELGKRLYLATSTIRNMRSQKTTCNIPFWKVALLAKMAGYDVKFERRTS